jgi:hypothetical protein
VLRTSDTTGYNHEQKLHPGGMPEACDMGFWHPSGMLFLSAIISGGVARQASLNHRLSSGKSPACPGGTVLPKKQNPASRVTSVKVIRKYININA